jgi:hypothetical protein
VYEAASRERSDDGAKRDKERGDNASRHCSPEARRNEQLSVTTTTIGRT